MKKLIQKFKKVLQILFVVAIPYYGVAIKDIPINVVQERSFSEKDYNNIKKEKKYQAFLNYKAPINKDEGKLKRLLLQAISFFISNSFMKQMIRIIPYLIIITAFVLIILKLSNVEFSRLLKPNLKKLESKVLYDNEDIYEIDIDELLKSALKAKDYRLAIRYNFLKTLKSLSDNEKIKWEVYKTNYDYQCELIKERYYGSFCIMTRYFEHIWYGEFEIDSIKYFNESTSLSNKILEDLI